ncbi:MAG: hypothetical protein A4E66_02068 [Syntrophus sp. PtaB.Bin001]|nr:MAG: hypothetical protein A4E66_02068 [Syntrophus sp. PtaB.Bin001]
MSADHDIHLPLAEPFENRLLLGLALEAVKGLDADRVIFHATAEGLVVLFRQDGRGNEHGGLSPVHGGAEGRPHGDLRFPKTSIAANQPVHGLCAVHVGIDVFNCPCLIGRFIIGKGGAEFLVNGIGRGERAPFHDFPGRINGDQLFGNLADGLFDPLPDGVPGSTAELVDFWDVIIGAYIAGNLIEAIHWKIELVGVLIADEKKIVLDAADIQLLQPPVETDAVILVNDIISFFQVAERAQKISFPHGPAASPDYLFPEKLLLADGGQFQVGEKKAPAQSSFPQTQHSRPGMVESLADKGILRHPDGQIVIFQKMAHSLHIFFPGAQECHQHAFL